jgi:NitT/TauT family transport system permease protein
MITDRLARTAASAQRQRVGEALVRTAVRLHLPTFVALAVIVAVWVVLSRRFGDYVLPPPGRVLDGLRDLIATGELWEHVAASLYRISLGFGAAVLASLLLGFIVSRSRLLSVAVKDITTVLNSTSVFVWIVLALIWFGLTDRGPMFTTFMITLPIMLSNVIEGIENVDRRLLEVAQVYRFGELSRFLHITIPSIIPYIVAGMKVGFALGLRVSVVAEIFGVTSGIGYMMNFNRDILRTDLVFAWAIVLIAVMLLTDKLVFESVSRWVQRWR